jgi:hypothetical protein
LCTAFLSKHKRIALISCTIVSGANATAGTGMT